MDHYSYDIFDVVDYHKNFTQTDLQILLYE